MIKYFRIIVAVNIVLYVLWAAMPSFDINWYDETTYKVLAYEGYGAIYELPNIILLGLSIFWVVVNLGLFFFINGSREIFFILLIINIVISILSGLVVYTSIESFLADASTLLYGVLIVLMIMPGEVKNNFTKNTSNKDVDAR